MGKLFFNMILNIIILLKYMFFCIFIFNFMRKKLKYLKIYIYINIRYSVIGFIKWLNRIYIYYVFFFKIIIK